MKKTWALLLALLLNHTLITGVLASVHSSTEPHDSYEPAHIHIIDPHNVADTDHNANSPELDKYSPEQNEFSPEPNSQNSGHDHDASAHVHIPCDHGALPLIINPPPEQFGADQTNAPPTQYLGLAYKPLLPPPNA